MYVYVIYVIHACKICIYIHVYIQIHVYVCYIHMYVHILIYILVYIYVYIYSYTNVYTHKFMHVHMYKCIYTQIYILSMNHAGCRTAVRGQTSIDISRSKFPRIESWWISNTDYFWIICSCGVDSWLHIFFESNPDTFQPQITAVTAKLLVPVVWMPHRNLLVN